LRVILVVDSTFLVAPEFPDPSEDPCPIAVASGKDVLGLLFSDTRLAVEGVVVYFHERVAGSWSTSGFEVLAGLAGDAALMDGFRFNLLE
jgi:hypothetical protein